MLYLSCNPSSGPLPEIYGQRALPLAILRVLLFIEMNEPINSPSAFYKEQFLCQIPVEIMGKKLGWLSIATSTDFVGKNLGVGKV